MADESAPETKSATFRIRMTRPPEFTITYKDKDDLFEAFKKNMAALGVSMNKVLWIDGEGELTRINNADIVMKAAEEYGTQKLHVINDADKERSSSPRCDDFPDHRRGCCSTGHNLPRHPRTSDRSRGHYRLSGRSPHHHHHHHHHHHQNPVPACVPCSCSTWCPTMGTGCGCGCSHGY